MLGWYFAADDRKLRYGDGRLVRKGATHKVDVEPELCERGLHASKRIIDALQYAPGSVICRVKLGGKVVHGDDKSCATERTYLAVIDGEKLLREFARKCALKVIHLWDAPRVVKDYLETGDESLRAAARDAAWAAARDAARDAAWAAARDAAGAAARAATRAAARDAAWAAARAAAWAAARDAQNKMLEQMVLEAMGLAKPKKVAKKRGRKAV